MHHGHLDLQKPPVEDSYIKAYHEQHQNDHLDQFRAPKMVKITQPTQAKPTKTKKVTSINPTQIQFVKTPIPTPTSFIEKQAVSKDYKVYDQESQSSNEFQYGLEKLPSAPSQYFRVAYPHNVNEIKSSLTEILKKSPNLQLHEFQELFTKPIEEYHSDVANIQHKPNIVQVAHIQPEAQLQQQRDQHNALLQQELAKYLARQQEEKVLQQHQENLKHIFVPNVAPKEVNVIYQQHHSEVLHKPAHVEIPAPQTYQHLEVKESPLRHPKYLEEPSSLGEESVSEILISEFNRISGVTEEFYLPGSQRRILDTISEFFRFSYRCGGRSSGVF